MKLLKKIFGRFNKKILIIFIILLLGIGAGTAFFVRKSFQKEEPSVISRYEVDNDSIASIVTIVGDRELSEIIDEKNGTLHKVEYNYKDVSTGSEDVKAYAEFLINECGFVPLMESDINNPAGYISVGSESAEEGEIFQIDIDYTPNEYRIILSHSSGELPKPKKKDKESFTRNDAQAFLNQFLPNGSGLEEPLSSYVTIFDQGRMIIDGNDSYGINVYQKGVGQSNEVVGKYFVALDKSAIYKYNVSDNSYELVYKDTSNNSGGTEGEMSVEQKKKLIQVQQSIKTAVMQGLDFMFLQ